VVIVQQMLFSRAMLIVFVPEIASPLGYGHGISVEKHRCCGLRGHLLHRTCGV
jgi:hypothetical protein